MRYLQRFSWLAIMVACILLGFGQSAPAAEAIASYSTIEAKLQARFSGLKIEKALPLPEQLALILSGKFKWSATHECFGLQVGPMEIPDSLSLKHALRRLVNAANADYRVLGDDIVVFALPEADWNKIMSLKADNLSIQQVLDTLFVGQDIKYMIDPGISEQKVSCFFNDLPLGTLMNEFFSAASVGYKVENNAIVVSAAQGPATVSGTNFDSTSSVSKPSVNESLRKTMEAPVYLDFVQLPFAAVIEGLLRGTGLSSAISPEITSIKVNATLKNVSLEKALREVIKAVGAEYTIADNVIRVTVPQVQQAALMQQNTQYAQNAQFGANWSNSYSNSQKVLSKSIPVQNVGTADIASAISQPGMQVSSTNSNRIVITGTEEQVKQAEKLIGTLDTTQNARQPIKISITAKVVQVSKGKAISKPRVLHSTVLFTVDGQPAVLETNTTIPDSDIVHVLNRALPVITPDGRIDLSGSVKINWNFKDAKRGNINFIGPDTLFQALLVPGKEQKVAEIPIGAGLDMTLDIMATAIIDKRGKARAK